MALTKVIAPSYRSVSKVYWRTTWLAKYRYVIHSVGVDGGNAVATGEGKRIPRQAKEPWLYGEETQVQDWFLEQTGRRWKPPSHAKLWNKASQMDRHILPENRRIFLTKLKWSERYLKGFSPWLPVRKDGFGWLWYLPGKWKVISLICFYGFSRHYIKYLWEPASHLVH